MKKEKKRKIERVVIDEECLDGCGEMEEMKKKKIKKKKGTLVHESLNDTSSSDVTDGVCKKKRKRQMADEENQVETAKGLVKEEVEKKEKKEKKVKNKSVEIKPENVKMEKEVEDEEQTEKDKVRKKAKIEKSSILIVNKEETEEQVKRKTKKKKETSVTIDGTSEIKKEVKVFENEIKLETQEETDQGEEVKVKKKKKKKAKTKDGSEAEKPETEGSNTRSTPSPEKMVEDDKMLHKKKDKSTKTENVLTEDGKTELKKKGKKEKGKKASLEVSEVVEKKKSKKSKGEAEEPLSKKVKVAVVKDEKSRETLVTPKKKSKKKSSVEVEQGEDDRVETGSKKRKKMSKEEKVEDPVDSPQVDVVFLSQKSGKTDEITINQERRQALQMEKASQPEKTAKLPGFGQWSTAQFGSSEQQQKFLRLMGGFKKGFQPAARSTQGANMAMGKEAQQQLQQGLMGEFERAHSRRMDFSNRGAGLGFAAPDNKKFSIDVNACRSVRFDD